MCVCVFLKLEKVACFDNYIWGAMGYVRKTLTRITPSRSFAADVVCCLSVYDLVVLRLIVARYIWDKLMEAIRERELEARATFPRATTGQAGLGFQISGMIP